MTGCDYVNLWGFLSSSPVDDRFKQKDSLKNYNPPVITDQNNFSFLVISDTHYYNSQPYYIKSIDANKTTWDLSFVIIAGDIVQAGMQDQFDLAAADFATTTLPVYPVIGNHDLFNNGFEIYRNVFGRTVYDMKIGNMLHMIFIDTANGTVGELQMNWLENILKGSDAKYRIVFSHYNLTDSEEWQTFTTYSYPDEVYYLFNLFDTYNVDYCVAGHLHEYDLKDIRGTKYFILNNYADNDKNHLLISVKNGNLEYSFF